ncbi:hypothetical protein VDGL01_12124 [Verticillium dahliae]
MEPLAESLLRSYTRYAMGQPKYASSTDPPAVSMANQSGSDDRTGKQDVNGGHPPIGQITMPGAAVIFLRTNVTFFRLPDMAWKGLDLGGRKLVHRRRLVN